MKAFYLVFFLTLLLSYILPSNTDKQWRWKLFFTFLPLFIFGALRVNFGNDYLDYELFFNQYHGGSSFVFDEDAHSEIGYQFLCYVMPSYRSVLVLNAFLLCLSLAVYIYNNVPRKYLWLAVLLIFLNAEKNVYGNMVGIRNGLVVTGFILGASFIQNRKIIPFAILTILLSTFHTAALLFLPIAYLVGRNSSISSREILIWIIVIIALLAFSVSGLIELAAPIISHSFDRYEYYLEEMTAHRGVLLTSASLVLILLIFTLYNSQKIILTKEQNSTVRLGLLYVVSAFLGSLAMRANYFYDIFFIGTVVILFANSKRDDLKGLSLASLAVLMSAYSLYLWHTCKWVAGNPYYTIYTSIIGSW